MKHIQQGVTQMPQKASSEHSYPVKKTHETALQTVLKLSDNFCLCVSDSQNQWCARFQGQRIQSLILWLVCLYCMHTSGYESCNGDK